MSDLTPSQVAGLPGDCPRRAPDLEIAEIADGIMVTHVSRRRVHYLNLTAAIVLDLCTGENDSAEIARQLQAAFELSAPPEAEIETCLSQLHGEGLIS